MAVVEDKNGTNMPGKPREIIAAVERRFPVRIRLGIPPGGLGRRHLQITATAGRYPMDESLPFLTQALCG
jgi:hypothetical protein